MARDFSRFSVAGIKEVINKSDNNENSTYNRDDWFNWRDMPVNSRVVMRLLPDANEDNPNGFAIERLTHTLVINGEERKVPCLKNYGDDCPICKVSAQFYKQEGDKSVNGKKYWRKKSHICQVLIVDDPLPPNPETGLNANGTVKKVSFGWQLWSLLMEGYDNGDLNLPPFFYKGGTDFIIKKSIKGEYPDYSIGTKYANNPSDLTEAQIEYVESQMVDLTTLLPVKPSLEKIEAMLNAALTGSIYDDGSTTSAATAAATSTVKQPPVSRAAPDIDDGDDAPAATSTKQSAAPAPAPVADAAVDQEADDILAAIRKRRQQKADA